MVASKDNHVDPAAHFSDEPDYVDTWPVHCVAGTAGAEFHAALDTDRIEAVFTKGEYAAAYSSFDGRAGGIGLTAWLRMRDVSEVDIVGLTADHCVRATALDAVREGFAATVLLDLTAGVLPDTTATALKRDASRRRHAGGRRQLRLTVAAVPRPAELVSPLSSLRATLDVSTARCGNLASNAGRSDRIRGMRSKLRSGGGQLVAHSSDWP